MTLAALLAWALDPSSALASTETPGRLVIADVAAVQSLDPHMQMDAVSHRVCLQIYEGLLDMPRPGETRPLLATSWRETGPRTWVFRLRQGVRFHNGEPFNAQAVVYSLERASRGLQREMLPLERVRSLGPWEVEITAACPSLLPRLAYGGLIVPPGLAASGRLAQEPAGTGPYRLVKRRGEAVRLALDPDYWGGAGGAQARELVFLVKPGDDELMKWLMTGRVDLALGINPHLKMALMRSGAPVRLYAQPSTRNYFLVVNPRAGRPTSQVLLWDPEFRRALNQALDMERIIKVVLLGNGLPLHGVLNPQIHGYLEQERPPYDPVAARRTLERLAPQGVGLTLAVPQGRYPQAGSVAQAVARYLEQVGVRVTVVGVAWARFLEKVLQGDTAEWDLYYLGWSNPPLEPSYTLSPAFCSSPLARVCPPGLSDLLARAFQSPAEQDPALYDQLQGRLLRLAPWIFLHQGQDLHASARGLRLRPRSNEGLRVFYDLQTGEEGP